MRKRGEKETKRESERKSDVIGRERRSGRERDRRRERKSERESETVNERRRKSGRTREVVIAVKTEADQGVYDCRICTNICIFLPKKDQKDHLLYL